MSRKPMRDLGRRQYFARINPLFNQRNIENFEVNNVPPNDNIINHHDVQNNNPNVPNANIPVNNEQDDGDNNQGPGGENNIAEHANHDQLREQGPLLPAVNANVAVPEERIVPDVDDLFELLMQNNDDNHILVGELLLNDLPAEFNFLNHNDRIEEPNIFEARAVPPEDDNHDDRIPNAVPNEGAPIADNDRNNMRRHNDDHPLYVGAPITVRESNLSILSTCLKHNLSMACVEDIITLVEMHCLPDGLEKNSLYKFQKYFGLGDNKTTKHFFCSTCAQKLNNENDICPLCPPRKNSYFLSLDVIADLRQMYLRQGFFESLQGRLQREVRENIISDIYDGEIYKSWMEQGFLSNPNNISLSWYTDGIPVFKSSKIGCWPIYLSINELIFKERKEKHNTLFLGIWYGDKKPHMNSFMKTFIPFFGEFLLRGYEMTLPNDDVIVVKAILLMGVCDLPAKCDCLNFVQFNGSYGCPVCFYRGEVIRIGERSSLQVYPFTNERLVLRTSERCEELADIATPENPQYGVKGPTALSKIMPDYMKGMCIDRMHSVDGGSGKKILTLIFHQSFRNEPFSLYEHVPVINSRLELIKPPKSVHRLPRTTNDLIHWKASELKNFIFYYSPAVFEGIMNAEYFQHYLLLVMAMFLLNADDVSHDMIGLADDLLRQFVKDFDRLYRPRYASINVHLLLHMSHGVKLHGPMWAYTCYEYEDFNGQMVKHVHGTRFLESQMANGHRYLINMANEVETVENEAVRDYCLRKKRQSKITEQICRDAYSVGCYKFIDNIPVDMLDALNNSAIDVNDAYMWSFLRALKNKKLYVSQRYTRDMKTLTSVVLYNDQDRKKIGIIDCFVKYFRCLCQQEACRCQFQYFAIIRHIEVGRPYHLRGESFDTTSAGYFYQCHLTNYFLTIRIDQLITPCIFIHMNGRCYVCHPMNSKELE